PNKNKHSEEHKAKIAARKKNSRSSSKTPDTFSGCIVPQLREDLKGKVSYIRINGKGPVTPVADMETLDRMVRLLRTEGATELFQQN
ncbi:unnamed protein product, partial [Pylaiella littoralis]